MAILLGNSKRWGAVTWTAICFHGVVFFYPVNRELANRIPDSYNDQIRFIVTKPPFRPTFTITNAMAKRIFTISEYYDRDRSAFYKAIQSVRESDMDMTGWLEYFVEGLATQMREVTHRGRQAIQRDVLVKEHKLNERQAAAVDLLLELGRITISELESRFPETSRRTLQRDLKQLIEKGICEESASSPTDPTKAYSIREDLF